MTKVSNINDDEQFYSMFPNIIENENESIYNYELLKIHLNTIFFKNKILLSSNLFISLNWRVILFNIIYKIK